MSGEAIAARAVQILLALIGAYAVALWFALIVWTFRDIESRSRSVVAQICSTLVVVLGFVPGVLLYLILRPRATRDAAFGRSLAEEYLLQGLADRRRCSACRRPVRDDFAVCPQCDTALGRRCPSCARLVAVGWALCPYCTAEPAQGPAAVDPREVPGAEGRRARLPHPLRLLRGRRAGGANHALALAPREVAPHPAGDAAPRLPGQ